MDRQNDQKRHQSFFAVHRLHQRDAKKNNVGKHPAHRRHGRFVCFGLKPDTCGHEHQRKVQKHTGIVASPQAQIEMRTDV